MPIMPPSFEKMATHLCGRLWGANHATHLRENMHTCVLKDLGCHSCHPPLRNWLRICVERFRMPITLFSLKKMGAHLRGRLWSASHAMRTYAHFVLKDLECHSRYPSLRKWVRNCVERMKKWPYNCVEGMKE